MPSPKEEPHWSATPVEVDADELMRSLLEEIEAGEAAQREQRQKDSPSTAGDDSQPSTDRASEAKNARMSGSCLFFGEIGPIVGPVVRAQKAAADSGARLDAQAVLRGDATRSPALHSLIVVYIEFPGSGNRPAHEANRFGSGVFVDGRLDHDL